MSDALTRTALPAASAGIATAKAVSPATMGDGGGSRDAVLIPRPSAPLQALQAGDVIEATIGTRLPDGQLRLTTPRYGSLLATWPNAPAPGTTIQLQVLSPGPPLRLQIAPQGLAQPARTALGPTPPVPSAARLSPPGPQQPAPLRPGIILQASLTPSIPQPASGGLFGPQTLTPPIQQLTVRILALQLPGQGPMVSPQSAGGVLQGTVLGADGINIRLQTGSGDITVRTNASLPPGTKLTLQILAQPGTIPPPLSAGRQARQVSALAHGWPALEASLEVLTAARPEAAAHFAATKLPQPGQRLTSGIVFFLSAIRGGRLLDWLGPDLARTLSEHNRGALMNRLAGDFTQLAQIATESASTEWRTILLPFLQDGAFQQLRIYLRDREGDGSSDSDDDAGTRFVVEVEISRIGALQLDGLIRQRRFDLIIRSHRPLPDQMRNGIQEIFQGSGADAIFAGNISFQIEPDFHIAPLEQLAGHAVGMFA